MSVTNTNTFNLTALEIITEAVELTGNKQKGQAVDSDDALSCLRTLNLLLKTWQTEGLFIHKIQDATLFLAIGQTEYTIGATGNHCCYSYTETTLSADAAQSATTITLTSTAGITAVDNIGIVLDDGTLHWTTVVNAATTSITTGIASAATAGNKVFVYTNKIQRPTQRPDQVWLRNSDGTDRPVNIVSDNEYSLLANKTSTGKIVQASYKTGVSNGSLRVWPSPDSVIDKLMMTVRAPTFDFALSDNADVPVEWLEPLTLALAYKIAPKFLVPLAEQQALQARMVEAKAMIYDAEESSVFIQPG